MAEPLRNVELEEALAILDNTFRHSIEVLVHVVKDDMKWKKYDRVILHCHQLIEGMMKAEFTLQQVLDLQAKNN